MLSEFLTSSYLLYKEDTNAVASWLATTAKRLKGKARKLAREAGKTPTPQTSTPSAPKAPTYIIAIKDFVALAEWIASYNKPPVRVPYSFVVAINRAISVRRSHGASLPDKDEKSDERHNYFIGVLEHVRDVLKPRMAGGLMGETETEAAKTSNQFEGLEVQEPSEEFLNAPDVTPTTAAPEVNYEAEQMQDMEEVVFAFQLLLEDYNKFRNVIARTWEGYRQGMFTLVSASLTTNTALDIARRLEEDAKPLLAKVGGAAKLVQGLYLALCMERGENQSFKERPGDDMNFRMYDEAQAIFFPTLQLLQAFVAMTSPRHVPHYKPGFFGEYDPTSDRSQKSAREKYLEDKIVLMEILTEFCYLAHSSDTVPAEDELMRGLRTAFKTKEISLSLVFAAQTFLDIHHVLREEVDRGFSDLVNTAQVISNSIELNFQHHANLRVETWPRQNDTFLRHIQERAEWVRTDPLIPVKQGHNRPFGEPFKLWKSHPLWCGLYAYSLQAIFQEAGVTFVNAWGSLLYTYHLYNAVRQEKLLDVQWKDMDLVMGLQGDVFVGDRPTTPDDYLKRFVLSMGYSATAFAKNKRRGPLQESKKGPRGIHELAPVSQMFKDRFYHNTGQADLSVQDVETILSKSDWEMEETEAGLVEMTLNRTTAKDKVSASRRRWQARRQLSATELLERLRNALQGETLELNIDYFFLHRLCWLQLRSIQEFCDQGLRDIMDLDISKRRTNSHSPWGISSWLPRMPRSWVISK